MEAAIMKKKNPKALGYGRFIFIENSKSRIQTSQRGTEQPENVYIFRYPLTLYMKYLSTLIFGYEMLK
jgi:hypothetical protein